MLLLSFKSKNNNFQEIFYALIHIFYSILKSFLYFTTILLFGSFIYFPWTVSMKIGIYGGSFDPIHSAHIQVAQAASLQIGFDRLFFIPAAHSPFKGNQIYAPDSLRLRWIQLAISPFPNWEVDPIEIERGGISYTVETLRQYSLRWPQASLYYLIGMDNAPLLIHWYKAEELAKLACFIIISRPGSPIQPPPPPFNYIIIEGIKNPISSSQIRADIASGKHCFNSLPPQAAEEILSSEAYKKI